MSREKRQFLGSGFHFEVWLHPTRDDLVVKFARISALRASNCAMGNIACSRTKKNLDALVTYVGKEYLLGERFRNFGGLWWVEQRKLADINSVESPLTIESALHDIREIARRSEKMRKTTGFALDWMGLGGIKHMLKMLRLPDYWALPNLVIIKENGVDRVKICDFGLLWTGRMSRDIDPLSVFPLDPFSWQVNKLFLRMSLKRAGIILEDALSKTLTNYDS